MSANLVTRTFLVSDGDQLITSTTLSDVVACAIPYSSSGNASYFRLVLPFELTGGILTPPGIKIAMTCGTDTTIVAHGGLTIGNPSVDMIAGESSALPTLLNNETTIIYEGNIYWGNDHTTHNGDVRLQIAKYASNAGTLTLSKNATLIFGIPE